MKKWMEKLIEQFDFDWNEKKGHDGGGNSPTPFMNEERATILFLLDIYNKHLIELEGHPVRKVRETLDEYARELVSPKDSADLERILFRVRQFFSAYRVDETAYFHKTFEDFRTIIWEFVDQLSEDIGQAQKEDQEIRQSLDDLKEAVESNSIVQLKNQSRRFIDFYVEKQFKKDKRRNTQMKNIRKNLNLVKKQLGEANNASRVDHLTGAYNRKTFDEYVEQYGKLHDASPEQAVSLLMLDIDHFKRVNDTYGHPIGDFVLKELVSILKSMFTRDCDLVARVGGEEFAVLLPDYQSEQASKKAEELLEKIRHEVFVHEGHELRFTVSIGIATLMDGEPPAAWIKRADLALYNSKNTGRNRATVAPAKLSSVA